MNASLSPRPVVDTSDAVEQRNWTEVGQEWFNRFPVKGFVALTALYVMAAVVLSSYKLLWLDELITLHIARLSSAAAIWHALADGADPNPPLTHLLVHACRSLFGEHEIVLRMPAIAGYWLGMLSLFLYLRRRINPIWALAGTLMSMSMAAFDYSYESRSYALFYGLTMLGFLAWSRAVDPASKHPGTALALMILALSAGVSTNYFAILAFFPIVAGEIVRATRRTPQRGLFKVWLGMALAATPLLAFRTMIANSIAQFAPYAWNKVSVRQVSDCYMEMVEYILYPILTVLLLAFAGHLLARRPSLPGDPRPTRIMSSWVAYARTHHPVANHVLPLHEAVAVAVLMAYPVLGYVVASIYGGMLSSRFVIPVCFGFAIAGTVAAFRVFGHLRFAAISVVLLCMAWFVSRESVVGFWYVEQEQSFYKVVDHLTEAEAGLSPTSPIVIPEPLLALTFQHYAPRTLAARIVFPVDFPAIRLYRRDDSPEENLWAGRGSLYTLPIVSLAEFQQSAGRYVIIGTDGNWLIEDLKRHRVPVERLSINTRAGSIGGFTPLDRSVPVYFLSGGNEAMSKALEPAPIPFTRAATLPSAPLSAAEVP